MNHLPTSQPKGLIGVVSISNCVSYYLSNKNGCSGCSKQTSRDYIKERSKYGEITKEMNVTNIMHTYLHTANSVKNITRKTPLYALTSVNCVWFAKPYQVCKVIS